MVSFRRIFWFYEPVFIMLSKGAVFVPFRGTAESGTVTVNTSNPVKVTLGYKPKNVIVIFFKDATHWGVMTYNSDISTTYAFRGARNGSTNSGVCVTLPQTAELAHLSSIDDDGFSVNKFSQTGINAYGSTGTYYVY